jgi:DNA-binding MarR family transcriptional regulator
MQRNLGIARNILSARLQNLVRAGLLERRRYQEDPERYDYRLTPMGKDIYPAMVAIMRWGDRHFRDEGGPSIVLRHSCGHDAAPEVVCTHCGKPLRARDVTVEPATKTTTSEAA